MRKDYGPKSALESYQDAVWSYLLEHCDIAQGGTLFVKFHTRGRTEFESHVGARWKHGYHRGDPKAKEADHIARRVQEETAAERNRLVKRERQLRHMQRGYRLLRVRKMLTFFGLGKYYELIKDKIFKV